MIRRQTTLGHNFLDVAIREGMPQVPSNRAYKDHWLEVSPFKIKPVVVCTRHQPTRRPIPDLQHIHLFGDSSSGENPIALM
jgi:hypothetical protein